MNELNQIASAIDKALNRFESALPGIEKKILSTIQDALKGLDTKNGKITVSVENLKALHSIRTKIGKLLKNPAYVNEVAEFTKAYNAISTFQDGYYSKIGKVSQTGLLGELDLQAAQSVQANLTGANMELLNNALTDMMRQSILSGESYSELLSKVSSTLISTESTPGALSRYAGTYATDAINDYLGERNRIIADDLGLDWYMYVGSNITTTREFCRHLTKKIYVHKSELPTIIKGNIDGHKCEIYPKTGLPLGMKAKTNPSNFIIVRGGWNCRHQLMPVAPTAVPANIRSKYE